MAGEGGYYPTGFASIVKVQPHGTGWIAVTSDGTRYLFDAVDTVITARGAFEWMLSRVENVFGDSTTFQWSRNASGRPFLASVRWGGRGDGSQYQLALDYETTPIPFVSYASGEAMILDQRVAHAVVGVKQGAGYVTRFSYSLDYQTSSTGPAFYLHSITKGYASGQSEPAVVYDYDVGAEFWQSATFEHISGLDDFLSANGGLTIEPDHSTLADFEQNGLTDLETAFDQTTVRQTPHGFVTESLPVSGTVNTDCRPAPSSSNKPRLLARLHVDAIEPQVVVTHRNAGDGTSRILVCDRLGQTVYDQSIAGTWEIGANTRLADLDMDQRPDIVRVSRGLVETLHNTSAGPQSVSFELGSATTLSPEITPITSWILDFNGDGRADLMIRHSAGVEVWLGVGGGQFESSGTSYGFFTASGLPLSNFPKYQLSHGDFNGDGLSDVILTQGRIVLLFTNRGGEFVQTPIPALSDIPWDFGYPVVADLSGSGNEEAVFLNGDQAMAIQLTSPSMGLLRSADDGKGTVLRFSYGRVQPSPGIAHRYAVLTQLTVESSGYDSVTYSYEYGAPVLHTLGRYLVGFSNVSKRSPLLSESLTFLNDDDVSGVSDLAESTDDRTPGIIRFNQRKYVDLRSHGVRWLRPASVQSGYRSIDGLTSLSTTTEYTSYEREFCPTVTVTIGPNGQLATTTVLANVAAIPDELSCLPAARSMVGTHPEPAFDFDYQVSIDRNAYGQPTRATQYGPAVDLLVLQEVSYDANHRIASIGAPGHGVTQSQYDALGRLNTVTDPIGLITQVRSFDPVTDALRAIEASRPQSPSTVSFIYDGRERLQATWDDVSGASQSVPVAAYNYQDPTNAAPGRIDTQTLADVVTGTSRHAIDLIAADGELMVEGAWLGDHASFGAATITERNAMTTRRKFIGPLTPSALDAMTSAGLRGMGTTLEETLHAGFAYAAQTTKQQQEGVAGVTTSELELTADELITRVHSPGGFTSESAVDASGNVARKTDENGITHRYTYDALGRLVHIATPDGGHSIAFDGFGRPAQVTRDGIGAIAFAYDPMSGLPIHKQWLDAAGAVTSASDTAYDATGRPTAVAQRAGEVTTQLGYDYDGQLDGTALPGQLGRSTRKRGDGWQRTMLYDALGRAYQQHTTLTGWRELTRDKVFRVDGSTASDTLTISDSAAHVLLTTTKETVLDALGRVSQIKVDGAVLYTLKYDAEGRAERADFASGEALTFSYDATTHERRGHDIAAPDVSGGVHWERDARGLIANETYSTGATTTQRTYGYDGRGALIRSATPRDTAIYSYSASGLPVSITDALGARMVHHDGATLTVGDVGYAWDSAGRVVAKDGWSLRYGPSGQIRRAERAGRQIDFVYDDENHRLLKRINGVPVRADAADGVLTEDHFFELVVIGGVVAGVLDNGHFTALMTDPRGTPFAGPDGTAGLASPFGVRTAHLGYSEVIDYARLGWDSDLDIIRMGVRDYDPKLSQFWTPDPLYFEDLDKCQSNPLQCALYGYAGGNPLSFVDPLGTDWMDWAGGVVGGIVGAFDAVTFGMYSKHVLNPSDVAVMNATTYYHTGHVTGELIADVGLAAIGVGEIGAAVKAGQFGVRMYVTANGFTMLAVTESTALAAAGVTKVAFVGASFMTSMSNKGSGDCQCSKTEPRWGERSPDRYDGRKPKYEVNKAHVKSSSRFNPYKDPLPADAEEVYQKAVPDSATNAKNWYGKNADGTVYRFSGSNGKAHFSGTDASEDGLRNMTDYAKQRLGM